MKMNPLLFHLSLCCISVMLLNSSSAGKSIPNIGTNLLPQIAASSGCTMPGKPYQFSPESLYDYIDGSADLFNAYGFVSLAGTDYTCGPDRKNTVTVDIYDMGEKLNAFGVFQVNRDTESPSLDIGAGSYGGDEYLVFYKDRFYVEVRSFITNPIWSKAPLKLGKKIEEQIPGDISAPRELSYFPEEGRIDGSEKYIRAGILGHAFLDRGLVCEYRGGDEVHTAFVAVFSSKDHAVRSLERHRDFLRGEGRELLPLKEIRGHGFVSQEPYHKNIVATQHESFIVGVYGLSRVQDGIELLKRILRRVKPSG